MMKNILIVIALLIWSIASNAQSFLDAIPFGFPDTATIINLRPRSFIKCDQQNNIWMGFGSEKIGSKIVVSTIGVARYSNGNWTTFNTSNSNIITNDVTSIEFQNNIVWIGSKSGLIKYDGSTFSVYNKNNSNIPNDTINDVSVSGNAIWIATNQGVSKFDGTNFTNYTTNNSLLTTNYFTKVVAINPNSAYAGSLNGLFLINGNSISTFNTMNSGILSNKISALHLDKNNILWISADSSFYEKTQITCIHYLKNSIIENLQLVNFNSKGCQSNFPMLSKSIFSDQNANIYFANNGNGGSFSASPAIFKINSYETKYYEFKNIGILWINNDGLFTLDKTNKLFLFNSSYYSNLRRLPKIDLDNFSSLGADSTIRYLNINKVSAPYSSRNNIMNWDLVSGNYEVPKGSCKKTIFASNLWLGGLVKGNLRVAAQTYKQSGTDFFSGPISIDPIVNSTDSANLKELSNTWKINRFDIEALRINHANGNIANGTYKIPDDILTWPAKGKGKFNRNYAPFADLDSNGIYEPLKGEYPIIKGDQLIYWIYNDLNGIHSESEGLPLGIEIHASIYAYQCNDFTDNDSNSVINYTTFNHFDIINRSQENIDSLRIGVWVDNDLGNYFDDYIGCNPKEGYSFCYNGDDYDDFPSGFGLNPPIASTLFLKTPSENSAEVGLGKFVYYNNDFSLYGNPSRPEHYWHYLNGKWKDGLSITYGGNGRGGTDTASFMFCGNNDLANRPNWTETTAGNLPGDRRSLNAMKQISLKPNEKKSLEYAHIYTRSNSGGAQGSFLKVAEDVKRIKNWYVTNSFPTCLDLKTGLNNEILKDNQNGVKIYPNPSSGIFTISSNQTIETLNVYDLTGKLIQSQFNSSKQNTFILNLSEFSDGIYLIHAISNKGEFSKSKIVLSR